jgi:hypothetical protein
MPADAPSIGCPIAYSEYREVYEMARKKRHTEDTEVPAEPVIKLGMEPEVEEQSGDLQGLSGDADADSESVRELVEDGQFYEAAVVSGVEDAPDADRGPVRTRQRKVDDVPPEYTEQVADEPKE